MNQEQIDKVLSDFYWPPNLVAGHLYVTTHDDNEGDPLSGQLKVVFGPDGDGWIEITHKGRRPGGGLRFRTFGGGGKYLKVRNALLLLAEAIRQEGED